MSVAFERRRHDAFGGLADFPLELELHRREADQCLRPPASA
jgi:hypothetical protein